MNHTHRIRRLESTIKPSTCPTCRGYPARIAYVDPETDEEWHAEMPESGCPDCGREPFITYRIVVAQDEGSS